MWIKRKHRVEKDANHCDTGIVGRSVALKTMCDSKYCLLLLPPARLQVVLGHQSINCSQRRIKLLDLGGVD